MSPTTPNDPPAAAENYFPKTIPLSQLREGEPVECDVGDDTKMVILRHGDQLSIFREMCPHMGAPMADGIVCSEDKSLRCPWHGYLFSYDTGEMLENPNRRIFEKFADAYETYKPDAAPAYKLRLHEYVIEGEVVRVSRSRRES